MAEVLKKGESQMPKQAGLKAPRDLSGLNGSKPVLDNRWGSKLNSVKHPTSMRGKK